jgi:hypothetical protein
VSNARRNEIKTILKLIDIVSICASCLISRSNNLVDSVICLIIRDAKLTYTWRQTKREILASLGSNLKLKDGVVGVNLEKPLQFIETAIEEEPTIFGEFEPKISVGNSVQFESLWTQNLSLLPLVDAFRNREIEFSFSLQNIRTVFDAFDIKPAYV